MQKNNQKTQIFILFTLIAASIIAAIVLVVIIINKTSLNSDNAIMFSYQGNTFNIAADTLGDYLQILKDQPYSLYEYRGSFLTENYEENKITDINEFLNRSVKQDGDPVFVSVAAYDEEYGRKVHVFTITGYYESVYKQSRPQKYKDMWAYFEVTLGNGESFSIDSFEIISDKTTRAELEEHFADYETLPSAEEDNYYVFRYKNHIVSGLFLSNGITTLSIHRSDYMDPFLDKL